MNLRLQSAVSRVPASVIFSFVFAASSLPAAPSATCEAAGTLFAEAPAKNWSRECYPMGNGRLGAMDFGGVAKQVVQFNEISLWGGLNEWDGAYKMEDTGFGGYRNFGEFILEFAGADEATPSDYRRTLDVTTGIQRTTFSRNGVRFTRESFASRPARTIVFRHTADRPGAFSGRLRLVSGQKGARPLAADARGLGFEGELANRLRYAAGLRLLPVGGTVRIEGDSLVFEQCDALTVILGAGTDYSPDRASGWRTGVSPASVVLTDLDAGAGTDFVALRAAHIADITALLGRVALDLGTTPAEISESPTAQRKKRYAAGGEDPDFEELLFNYGRYLLVSSSRAGGLPANLQGLWNNTNNPPWAGDYHNDVNIQMNYWAAENTNLPECHRSLIDYVVAQSESCRVATRKKFGPQCRGWTARYSQSIAGGNGWEWNVPASAWYSIHLFDHWAFSRDRQYLRTTAYPMLKELCEFWEDRLKPLEADGANFISTDKKADRGALRGIPAGTLVAPDGWSPEHGPHEDGVTYSQQLVRELFRNYLVLARELGVDAEYQKKVEDLHARLLPDRVGKWGQLQEWMVDRDNPEDQHRHTSQLFSVYPGCAITREKTPELATAAAISLRSRSGNHGKNKDREFTVDSTVGDSRQSWTWPWRCALWARFGEAEKCAVMVRGLLTHNTHDNLLAHAHGVFQIDGNLGIPGAIAEMLLQSHADEIRFLPAIPKRWADGSVKGLRARGGFTVDMDWKDGKVTSARLVSNAGAPVRLRAGVPVTVTIGGSPVPVVEKDGVVEFRTQPGAAYLITAK